MSFAISSRDVRIEQRDGHTYLHAHSKREDGSENDTHLNLDDVLGNIDGHFQWGGKGFTGSAENVHLSVEGQQQIPVLRARLRDAAGNYQDRDVNLAERIENDNGNLTFQ